VDILDGNNYSVTGVSSNPVKVRDEVYSAGFNLRRELAFRVPVAVKVGALVNQQTKDTRGGAFSMAFTPPGGAAAQVARNHDLISTGYSDRISFTDPFGGSFKVKWLSPYKLHPLYQQHPEWFTRSVANDTAAFTSKVNTSKKLEETISAAYFRGDMKFFHNRLWLVGGSVTSERMMKASGR